MVLRQDIGLQVLLGGVLHGCHGGLSGLCGCDLGRYPESPFGQIAVEAAVRPGDVALDLRIVGI